MAAQLAISPEQVTITFPGGHALLALKRSLCLPLADIAAVSVMAQREAKQSLGVRLGGGYWPGWFATGHFTYRRRKGERQLWCCYRADRVLVIDTHRPKPRRVVLQVDDPDAAAARITELMGHGADHPDQPNDRGAPGAAER